MPDGWQVKSNFLSLTVGSALQSHNNKSLQLTCSELIQLLNCKSLHFTETIYIYCTVSTTSYCSLVIWLSFLVFIHVGISWICWSKYWSLSWCQWCVESAWCLFRVIKFVFCSKFSKVHVHNNIMWTSCHIVHGKLAYTSRCELSVRESPSSIDALSHTCTVLYSVWPFRPTGIMKF